MLEASNDIVGIPHEDDLASGLSPSPLVSPRRNRNNHADRLLRGPVVGLGLHRFRSQRQKSLDHIPFNDVSIGNARPLFHALRAFEATARLRSMSAAADELSLTHGAISRHVRSLEGAEYSAQISIIFYFLDRSTCVWKIARGTRVILPSTSSDLSSLARQTC